MPRKHLTLFIVGVALYLLGWAALLLAYRPAGIDLLRAALPAVCSVVVLRVVVMALARWPLVRSHPDGAEAQPRQSARRVSTERRTWSERRRTTVPVAEDRRLGIERRQRRSHGLPSFHS